MKEVTIKVKNCRSCCFGSVDYMDGGDEIAMTPYYNCLAPYPLIGAGNIDSYWRYYKTSPNCPLKKQSLKIEFKK